MTPNRFQLRIVLVLICSGVITWGISGVIQYVRPNMMQSDWYPAVPFQKGMSFSTWGAASYNATASRQEYLSMQAAGIEWVCINNWYSQSNLTSHDIHPNAYTDTNANLTRAFLYIHDTLGMHVLYKPMLNLDIYNWRSYINFTSEWMAVYTAWMVENAKTAAAGHVEILCIGCEMGSMQVHSTEVRAMISQIRTVYHGLLTYSANHDNYGFIDWYDAIDIIGVSMYSPMTTEFNPSVQELGNFWDGFYYRLEELSARWNRPILFTEIGAQALDGSNMVPNDNRISTQPDVGELRDIYASLFSSRIWSAPWFKGTHWWIWDFSSNSTPQFNPKLPPVLAAIKDAYTPEHAITPSDIPARVIIPLVLGVICSVLLIWKADLLLVKRPAREETEESRDLETSKGKQRLKSISRIVHDQDVAIGLQMGILVFFIFSNFIQELFGVIYSTFSYSVILHISTSTILMTFAALLIAAIMIGGLAMKFAPRFLLLGIFFLILGVPLVTFGDNINYIFFKTLADLLVMFLLIGAILVRMSKKRLQAPVKTLFASMITVSLLMAIMLFLDRTAMLFALVPLMLSMGSKPLDNPGAINMTVPVKENTSRVEMMGLYLGFLAGILVPFEAAGYNLINLNTFPMLLTILPPILCACLLIAIIWLVHKRRHPEVTIAIDRLGSTKGMLVYGALLSIIGIPFALLVIPHELWWAFSSLLFVQFVSMLLCMMGKSLQPRVLGRAYFYILVVIAFFALGFILSCIKGLFILEITFLDIQGGQIVTRTDFSTIPPNVVGLIMAVFMAACAGLTGIMLGYRKIVDLVTKKIDTNKKKSITA